MSTSNNLPQKTEEESFITIYLRCPAIHSRGELVNLFFFAHRDALGIRDWFDADNKLIPSSPLESVEVKSSRKPYYLVEFRYPLPSLTEEAAHQGEGHSGSPCIIPDSTLVKISSALLSLGESVKEYNGQPLVIAPASNGITVNVERMKLEGRDRSKRQRETENELKGASAKTNFVPRALRRREK